MCLHFFWHDLFEKHLLILIKNLLFKGDFIVIRQTYVTIIGKKIEFTLPENLKNTTLKSSPDCITAQKNGTNLSIYGNSLGRGYIELSDGMKLRVASFREKEAFMITAISCNHHAGWNPGIQNEVGHPQCCGPDMSGNAFNYALNLEKILHKNNYPITWLTDGFSYRNHKNEFENFTQKGDEIGFMPESYSHFNSKNYNLFKSELETFCIIEGSYHFLSSISGKYIRSAGFDQFIGAIGTNTLNAASKLGINALWGIGIDHKECDTSMFHFGCPWNPYKPSKNNFRIPGDNCFNTWIFDWTFRDVLNTVRVPGICSGSVMFSTDVDDIFNCKIAYHQKNYYNKIAENLLSNLDHNDYVVFLLHQEDHDSGDMERNEYLGNFFATLPGGFTKATMGEVADWLDIKFPGKKEPKQSLYLEDQIDCHEEVFFYCGDSTPKPSDWPEKGEKYPPHIVYYDKNNHLIYEKDSHIPYRYIDYSKQEIVPENGSCSIEKLPHITINKLEYKNGKLSYDITSDENCQKYPLAIWTREPITEDIKIAGGFVKFINLKKGKNLF